MLLTKLLANDKIIIHLQPERVWCAQPYLKLPVQKGGSITSRAVLPNPMKPIWEGIRPLFAKQKVTF